MGYEELFAAHVLPVVHMRRVDSGTYVPIRFVGTGVTFGEGTFVTCWHCVSSPLTSDEAYCVVRRESWPDGTYDTGEEIADLSQDRNGTDLSLGRVGFTVKPRLTLATIPLAWGEDVVACGYPLPTDTRDLEAGTPLIKTEARLLRGYVTRMLLDDRPGWEAVRAVEVDMPAPPGISGGPLFRPQPLAVVGVVYGEHDAMGGDSDRVYTFALAHHLTTLMAAAGPATDMRPLAEHLSRK